MIIRTIPVGALETNCYIIADEETEQAIVVDPGDEPDRILDEAGDLDIKYIVLTHAHFDHVGALAEIKEATGAQVAIHPGDTEAYKSVSDQAAFWGYKLAALPPPDILLNDGDEIMLDGMAFKVIHTPGHSPGSMCIYTNGVLFAGDTLFAGSVGRTDFPGGSIGQLRDSFRVLMSLPDETSVFPGHGPATSIGQEKVSNMFASEFLGS